MDDFKAFVEFKQEIQQADNLKDLDLIFVRLIEQNDLKSITSGEFAELKRDITEKHDRIYEQQLTEQQKRDNAIRNLDNLQKFKIETQLADDEEWRGDIIYCKKCNTPRSFIFRNGDELFVHRAICKCQGEEYCKQLELEKIESQKKIALERLQQIGINIDKYSINKFETKLKFQKAMLDKVQEFLNDTSKGIIIDGQSGCGKTFILSAALIELANKGHLTQYLKWLEQGKYIKSLITDTDRYKQEINKYKNAEILYIDDFLKTGRNCTPTDADISLAFEIIDYRKESKLPTMISSERNLNEILSLDEALGGRILELCKIRLELNNNDFPDLINYRLKF